MRNTSTSTTKQRELQQPLLQTDVEAPAEQQSSSNVLRLLAEARPEACTLTLATIFLLIGALANLAVPKLGKVAQTVTEACLQQHICTAVRCIAVM
jgi:hypothetical protein